MELLAKLLPALRETRIPLATGYAWLITGWLWFGDRVPTVEEVKAQTESTPSQLIWRALSGLGDLGTVAAVSFTAYLVGTLLGAGWDTVFRQVDERVLREQAKMLYAEAKLRIQLAPAVAVGGAAVAVDSSWWAWTLVALPVTALGLHGWRLWARAKVLPVQSDLSGRELTEAYLVGARMSRAQLARADLFGATLRGVDLTGRNFDRADLSGARWDSSTIWPEGYTPPIRTG